MKANVPKHTLPGGNVEIDDNGFLVDSLAWTPEVAEEMARASGLGELSPRHWRVVLCCREAVAREGLAPDLEGVAQLAGLSLAELDRLFRPQPFERIAKIAGLPQPPQCTYEP